MQYTATVRGRTPKLVQCEKCAYEYVYFMSRKGYGEARSLMFLDNKGAANRATDQARERLAYKLDHSCDPVPCPACGWYQENMVARARHLRYGWLGITLTVLYPVTVVMAMLAGFVTMDNKDPSSDTKQIIMVLWIMSGVFGALTVGLTVLSRRLHRRFNPNGENVEERKKRGQSRTISKKEYLKYAAQETP